VRKDIHEARSLCSVNRSGCGAWGKCDHFSIFWHNDQIGSILIEDKKIRSLSQEGISVNIRDREASTATTRLKNLI
jgi:hypothetical protein